MLVRTAGLCLGTVGFALSASPASAAVVALWHMDEPSGSQTMVDSSGSDNNGTMAGAVTTGSPGLVSGTAYTFSGKSSYVTVRDNDTLDPFSAPMTITATVRTVGGAMPTDSYDLVRKGLTTTAGGDWKMEIIRSSSSVGRLHCVFKGVMADGRRVAVARTAGVNVNDGRPHTLQCIKTPSAVRAVVDGKTYTTTKPTGWINNTSPVTVGAKSPTEDGLRGTLDEVSIDIG